MTESFRRDLLRHIRKLQFRVQDQPEFLESAESRGLYVALLTLETAIEFNDCKDLGIHMAKFCEQKQQETAKQNGVIV